MSLAVGPVAAATTDTKPVKKAPTTKSTTTPGSTKTPPPPPPPAPEPELVVVAAPTPATAPAPQGDPLEELMQLLDIESEIATRTKLNVDFVPGMVTVLHHRDLLAKGVRNVFEALALVPGIELSMASDGQPQVLVRGLGKVFASTKIKFLVDGMDVNTALGPNIAIHAIPIERVERIEVVRGPGSAIYGEYALAGVVDIITTADKRHVYGRADGEGGFTLGGAYVDAPPGGRYAYSVAIDGGRTNGGDVRAGEDRLYGTPFQGVSNAPGDSNESHEHHDVLLRFRYDDFQINAQRVHVGFGDHFGVNDALPEDDSGIVRRWTLDTVQLSKPWTLSNGIVAGFELNWMSFVGDVDDQMLWPVGYPNATTTEGLYGGPHYEETRTGLAVNLDFPSSGVHKWVGGLEASRIEQGDVWNDRNFTLTTPPVQIPEQRFEGTGNWIEEDLERVIVSLYAQDQWTASKRLTVTLGARVDRYDDIGNALSPRIAAVYQAAEHQILKAQFSDSFRPPSFLEMYSKNNPIVNGNEDIDPERMHTYELGYIYNDGQTVYRLTAYVAELHDVITIDQATRTYVNGDEANFHGVEMELSVPVHPRLRVDANASFNEAEMGSGAQSAWGAAGILANVGALYRVSADRYLGAQVRHVGARERVESDTRSDLNGYTTLDLTYSDTGSWYPDLTLRVGIKNVFDADVRYPAAIDTYADDYPRPGRTWWLSAEYEF